MILGTSFDRKRRAPDLKGLGIGLIASGLTVVLIDNSKAAQAVVLLAAGGL